MRKAILLFSVTLSAVFFSTAVFAAAWTVPTNVRIVQKSNTDTNGRIYGTIQAAINSITNASASNPYIVKVMPGIYNETVTMKAFVTVEGSGPDATTITAAASPTVTVANNSAIRNVKIMNTASSTGRIGLSFINAAAAAENVAIELSNGQGEQWGVYVDEGSAVTLKNLSIKVVYGSGSGSSYGVYSGYNAGKTTILDSHITIDGGSTGHSSELTAVRIESIAAAIRDSVLETIGHGDHYTVQCSDTTSITGSKVTAAGTDDAYKTAAIYSYCEIQNSEIRATNTVSPPERVYSFSTGGSGGTGKVAASLIQGIIDIPMKIVNCWDENYDPVPNQ